MRDLKKTAGKAAAGLLVFAIFFVILSPLYTYRSVVLKLTCSSPSGIEITASHCRYPADAFTGRSYIPEKFILSESEKTRTVSLELPTGNRIGGFRLAFSRTMRPFRIHGISLVNHGKEHPVELKTGRIDHENRSAVVKTADSLTVRPGKNAAVSFPFRDYMPVNRSCDPVMALYMALLALLPSILAFSRFEVICSRKNGTDLLYAAAALLMLTFPVLLIDYFGLISDENRFLNRFPELLTHRRFNTAFARQFEEWFSDRFSGREAAIRNERKIFAPRFGGDGNVPSSRGLSGKAGWMFLGHSHCVNLFRNRERFTDGQLKLCAEKLSALDQYCTARKIRLYVMLIPDKERVYPEFYPDGYPQVHPESRIEQFHRYLRKHTKIRVIFPLKELREAKKKENVYFKTGTHWNPKGARVAFEMLLRELKKDFPDVPADQPNAVQWKESLNADVDIARLIGFTDPQKQLPPESLRHVVPVIRCGWWEKFLTPPDVCSSSLVQFTASVRRKNALKIFVCADSFWGNLHPFMFPAADRLLHASFLGGTAFELQPYRAFIEEFSPDVMVIESAERFLDRFLTISMEEP